MPNLKVSDGGKDFIHQIDGEVASIGRADTNTIEIDDAKASKEHCRVERVGNRWKMVDLESKNGTRVNGDYCNKAWLEHGDEIQIGKAIAAFRRRRRRPPVRLQHALRRPLGRPRRRACRCHAPPLRPGRAAGVGGRRRPAPDAPLRQEPQRQARHRRPRRDRRGDHLRDRRQDGGLASEGRIQPRPDPTGARAQAAGSLARRARPPREECRPRRLGVWRGRKGDGPHPHRHGRLLPPA